MQLSDIPLKEILLVIYGGLFGFTLSQIPKNWVYVVLGISIILTVVIVL